MLGLSHIPYLEYEMSSCLYFMSMQQVWIIMNVQQNVLLNPPNNLFAWLEYEVAVIEYILTQPGSSIAAF